MREEIVDILTAAKETRAVHQKNALLLKNLYDQDPVEFWECFQKRINNILIVSNNSPSVSKSIEFFGHFCSLLTASPAIENEDEEIKDHPLFVKIMEYLLFASENALESVRLRSCQLLNSIFDHSEGMDMGEDLWQKCEEYMLLRLNDGKHVIRQLAVVFISKFQVPSSKEDKVIEQLINIMSSDTHPKVRESCVLKIALRKDSKKVLITRINDVDISVKLAAYKKLSLIPKFLRIAEKRQILRSGFVEESDKIKTVLKDLITSWLNYYEGNVLIFMQELRFNDSEEEIKVTSDIFEKVLHIIFNLKTFDEIRECLCLNENKLILPENLDFECVSCWRIFLEHLNKNKREDELNDVLPELLYLCDFIQRFCQSMANEVTETEFLKHQFILNELFLILKIFDYSEPAMQQYLNKLVEYILKNITTSSDLVETIISTLQQSFPNVNERIKFIAEIISDILYPTCEEVIPKRSPEDEIKIAKLKVKLNCLEEEKQECVDDQQYGKAQEIMDEIEGKRQQLKELENKFSSEIVEHEIEKATDICTTLKCLNILCALLLLPDISCMSPVLMSLRTTFVQELLIHENDAVRVRAYKCYALFGIIDKDTAAIGIHFFSLPICKYQNKGECDIETLLVCIGAVTDLLRIHGSQLVAVNEIEELSESIDEEHQVVFLGGTSLTYILKGLVELMDNEEAVIEEKAALGLCQLILSDRIVSPTLVARLILKWCNPLSNCGHYKIKQIIGFTLEKMVLMPHLIDQIQDAIFITLKMIFFAPNTSPLVEVIPEDIAKFLFSLCKTSPQADEIHYNLVMKICGNLQEKPKSQMNLLFSKIILYLDLPGNKEKLNEVLDHCHGIKNVISDSTIINNVSKFINAVKKKLNNIK